MRQIFVQGAGGLGCRARRFVEKQVDLWKRRQAFLDPDFTHVADQRATPEHCNRDSCKGRRLQTSDAVADARDAPSQTCGFESLDRVITIDVAWG